MRTTVRTMIKGVGRRGVSLLFVALLAAVFAFALWAAPTDSQSMTLGQLVPLQVWAVIWSLTAAVCVGGAFAERDRVAFAVATCVMTLWSLLYFTAWLTGAAPRGWLAGAIYLAFSGYLVVLSTWPEAPATVSLGEAYPDAIITADSAGVITGWFGSAAAIFGWSAQEIIGRPITILMPDYYRAEHLAAYTRAAAGQPSGLIGSSREVEALHRDGPIFPVLLFLSSSPAPSGPLFTAVIRPIPRDRG